MQRLLCLGLVIVLLKSKDTFNEFKHPQLHVLQKQPNTDCREVAVSHFFVFQHPLEEPLQMGLSRLQSLTTPGKVGYVRSPLSRNTQSYTLLLCHVLQSGAFLVWAAFEDQKRKRSDDSSGALPRYPWARRRTPSCPGQLTRRHTSLSLRRHVYVSNENGLF